MSESRLRLLQDMPIFGGIQEKTLRFILDKASITEANKGDNFFQEGDLANSMYVLEKGSVAIFHTRKGERYLLRTLEAGDCFGEMALMDCNPRSATAQALRYCQAIEITSILFAEIFDQYPQQFTLIQMNMGREVSRRLRESDKRR
ncbi:MAG: cyclic nucleotide-binding domain-containing protein [Thiogranum sp.]